MNDFQNELQQLSGSQFQTGDMTPWNQQSQYPPGQFPNGQNPADPSRQCGGFGGFHHCGGFGGGFHQFGGFCGGFHQFGGFCGGFHHCGGFHQCGGFCHHRCR
jgi:heterocycloanthracin/sonorensin family bacteriocin